jgi:hypothetical protein
VARRRATCTAGWSRCTAAHGDSRLLSTLAGTLLCYVASGMGLLAGRPLNAGKLLMACVSGNLSGSHAGRESRWLVLEVTSVGCFYVLGSFALCLSCRLLQPCPCMVQGAAYVSRGPWRGNVGTGASLAAAMCSALKGLSCSCRR